ncbi:hypothetical protein [Prevotella conceptionensis]|jgi:hypothetical protein|uniref:hypothetical protein n=1 Tax=Prevotella conceptionensis TaxID=340486 RepID=UPI0005CA7008|nr:hypothetical protein [Prevotella conceptionensis]
MNKNIIYAEMGNPWQFPSFYEVASCKILFMDLHNFGKEGPLCGKLFINEVQIMTPHHDGFGGPIIISDNYIYLPLYHMIINNRSNYSRTYVAEIDISKKSYRIIGKRVEYAVVFLDSMVNDTLYYYNYSRKDDKWLRRINIHSVNRPWSWSERFFHFYHELLFFFRDLF